MGGYMYPLKLKPAIKDYIWGGERLKHEFGILSDSPTVAEAWMLSCNAAGASTILDGPLAGKKLDEAIFAGTREVLGENNSLSEYFPVLIKFLDVKKDLSIQVHPDDEYAGLHEGGLGKTEMWYVLDAQEDAYIYYGFSRAITKDEMRSHIEKNTISEVLNRVPVKKGDVFFIEAGTIHTIGKGILIAEIQQNSDATYRVYDYNRTDKNGARRQLHVEQAIAVTNTGFVPGKPEVPTHTQRDGYKSARLAACDHFTVDLLSIESCAELVCDQRSFASLVFLSGEARICFDNPAFGDHGVMDAAKGASVFIPAGTGKYRIEGTCEVLLTVR